MTKREGAIVGAYTGFLCGSIQALHEYAEEKIGRPVWSHEFGDESFAERLRELARDDFQSMARAADPDSR